jgi:hypothetical protein
VNIKTLLFGIVVVAGTNCDASELNIFQIAHSTDTQICGNFYRALPEDDDCLMDENCFTTSWGYVATLDLTRVSFKQVAINQYGYTEVHIAERSGKSYSLVYLDRFQGDRHPRILETWKVDTAALNSLMAQNPHPLPYDEWIKGGHGITQETFAPEFAQILARSEKISDDEAPVWMPVFTGAGVDYAVSRECVGKWEFGGNYHCSSVVKVTVKRLLDGGKTLPICEFSTKGPERSDPKPVLDR